MSVNRVVVHKRNQQPSPIDQLGTTIPMAELFAQTEMALAPKPKPDRPPRLIPIPLEKALASGDLPEAFAPGRRIQAVVIELDRMFPGASRWHMEGLAKALAKFGMAPPAKASGSVKDVLEQLSQERKLPRFLHKPLESLAKTYFEEILHARCRERIENELLVARLHREGLRIAIRSSLAARNTRLILDLSGLRGHVDDIVCCEDLASFGCAKDELQAICEHLGLPPHQVVAVEGDAEGVESAGQCGLLVCELRPGEAAEWPRIQRFVSRVESTQEGSDEC